MPELFIKLRQRVDIVNIAIDLHSYIAVFTHLIQNLLMLALAATDYGSDYLDFRSLAKCLYLINNLIDALPRYYLAAFRTMRYANSCEQQTKVVVYFGDRSDSGTRVVGRALLVNGHSRRESFDVIYIRLIHLTQELTCV